MTQDAPEAGDTGFPTSPFRNPLASSWLATPRRASLSHPCSGGSQASWNCHHSGGGPELGPKGLYELSVGSGLCLSSKPLPWPLSLLRGAFSSPGLAPKPRLTGGKGPRARGVAVKMRVQ